ncbi:hypothetical protein BD560DRAFT_489266 [Blakeslea trispora]|nr:hypothetical protein BD560DRAFT_489266 [Blakeslea trispora]
MTQTDNNDLPLLNYESTSPSESDVNFSDDHSTDMDSDNDSYHDESDMSVRDLEITNNMETAFVGESTITEDVSVIQNNDMFEVVEQELDTELEDLFDDEEISSVDQSDSVNYWSTRAVIPVMNSREFFNTFGTVERCQNFFINNGIFLNDQQPPACGENGTGSAMYLSTSSGRTRWRCNGIRSRETGRRCCNGTSRTVRSGSFFENRDTPLDLLMCFLWCWSNKLNRTQICNVTGLSFPTVRTLYFDWLQMIQEDLSSSDCRIGGVDFQGNPIIVEIDESKFGKRKYNRGHRVDGVWVVGGVERTPERR